MVEHLDLFMPEQTISPLQFAKLKGKQRKRASAKNIDNNSSIKNQEDDLAW
jgi:putative transcriptional regulator